MKAAQDAIRSFFTTAWANRTPVIWPNEGTDVPDAAPWVHIEIHGEDEKIMAFGGGRGANEFDWIGRIEAHVMVPRQEGTGRAVDLADQIAAIFRSQRFSGVSCWTAPMTEAAVKAGDGKWWRQTLLVNFTYRFVG